MGREECYQHKSKKESHRFRWLKEIYGGTEQQLHINYTFIEDSKWMPSYKALRTNLVPQ